MTPPLVVWAVSVLLLVVAGHLPRTIRSKAVLAAGVLVVAAATTAVAVMGWHWPLAPLFVGTLLAFGLALLRSRRRRVGSQSAARFRRVVSVIAVTATLELVASGLAAGWAFPPLALPAPTGPARVGTTTVEWVDETRPEPATADPADQRFVVAQLWYPADPGSIGGERARYLGPSRHEAQLVADGVASAYGFPAFLLDALVSGRSNAYADAPPQPGGRFPVVLFSPGLQGIRMQNTAWAEELASHGYLVVALDHPGDSAVVVRRDGAVVPSTVTASGDDDEDQRRAAGWTSVRAADLRFALTQLERLHGATGAGAAPLAGRIDTHRVAVTGHSLGGAAALQAAAQDRRFRAVIDLDGFPHNASRTPYAQPLLALVAGSTDNNRAYATALEQVLGRGRAPSYRVVVPDAGHLSLTDAPFFLPPVPSLFGSIDRAAGPQTTASASLAFLDATIRDGDRTQTEATLGRLGELTTFGR